MQKTLAILFLLICFSSFTVSAQSLSHSVINTTGNFHQNTSGSLTYSIGENAFMTLQDNPYWLSQGFLQGDDSAVITSLDAKIENHHFKVYPNPTVDKIKVETDLQTLATVIIYDLQGKKVLEKPFTREAISLQQLATGTYLLYLLDQKQKIVKTFRIIKH